MDLLTDIYFDVGFDISLHYTYPVCNPAYHKHT